MKSTSRLTLYIPLAAAAVLCLAGSHVRLTAQVPGDQGQYDQAPPDQGPDPADVNQAPSGQSYTTEAPPQQGQGPDDSDYAEQPTEQTTQAPPPLPDYDQPPAPADGYMWTPGYWAWGASGYYWVPGVWVEPPYMGALWTPGYWRFWGARYAWYPGHWGYHIGFYGGIHYGFGFVGFGYEGGYWHGNHFFYNRVYNHIDINRVHNVYSYHANVRGNDWHGRNDFHGGDRGRMDYGRGDDRHFNNMQRPSYRGGPNGVQSRPMPQERSAWHEPTAPRMNTQMQHAQSYAGNRGQYANQNHGRPGTFADSHPLHADRNVQPQQRGGGGQRGGGQHGGGHR